MSSQATPRLRVAGACGRLGRAQVVARCLNLLKGGEEPHDFVLTLGGAPAVQLLGADIPKAQAYWLRVWAARGLLWAGPGEDVHTLRAGLADESWRVREMTCKVIARYRIGDLLEYVSELKSDPIARVRSAAERAATRIVEAEA